MPSIQVLLVIIAPVLVMGAQAPGSPRDGGGCSIMYNDLWAYDGSREPAFALGSLR
jgi:hypothetical protein